MSINIPDISGTSTPMKTTLVDGEHVPSHNSAITAQDTPSIDAFGRWRVSNPVTLFDSKQLFEKGALFWDESLVTGGGITSTHNPDTASSVFQSTLNTAGRFVRQTFMRFNYQPGKSAEILVTGVLAPDTGGTGVQRRMGYYDDDNGLFLQHDNGVGSVVLRSNATGTPTDQTVTQPNWNVDKMDGTGVSGITLDWSKSQILFVDFEWLGVGRVRMCVVVDGLIYKVHEFLHSNRTEGVYMSTPNLPVRYEMITGSSSPASSMESICSSVISEGGSNGLGSLHSLHSPSAVSCSSDGVSYLIMAARLKSDHFGASVIPSAMTILETAGSNSFLWEVILNPTVAGTTTFADQTNSSVQVVHGGATNTVTGGHVIGSGFTSSAKGGSSAGGDLSNAILLGSSIAGVADVIAVVVTPISSTNLSIYATMNWKEIQ